MEVLTETNSAISHRRRLKFIKYDSPAFREQPGSGSKAMRTLREQYKIQLPKNIARSAKPGDVSLPTGKLPSKLPSCTANELVNVCYAKIWRGSRARNFCAEEEEDVENKPFPIYLGKDLDKLQKLRIKCRTKSRKCMDSGEVKAWIETPEKFIDLLAELRGGQVKDCTENGSQKSAESASDGSDNSDTRTEAEERGKPSHAVHFPQHVLLCAALQEGDSKELEQVIKNHSIDLNSLTKATGYDYLHKTILNDQLQCARMLIESGIDVNGKDSEGVSPIALAFRLTNFPILALLVHSGADVGEYTQSRVEEMNKVNELSRSVSKVFEMDV